MPQGHKNEGSEINPTKQKQNRVTDTGKRPPKWEGASKRSQPANFARESNPASQLVKILPKDYIQHERLFTNQTRKSTRNRATLNQTFLKKQQCNQQRRPRGAKRRKKRTLKQNQLRAKKTTVQPEKVTEGSKEKEETHSSKTNSEPRKPQYSQKRRPRGAKGRKRHTQAKPIQSQENRSTATKGDRGGQRGVNTQDQSQRDHSTAKTKATE